MSRPHDPHPREASGTAPQQPGAPTVPIPARPGYTTEPPPGRTRPAKPPTTLTVSFWLWIASFAVGLGTIAYSLTVFDELRTVLTDQVRARQPDIGADLLNRAVNLTLYIGLGGSAAVILVQLLLAILMRFRRGWARILLALVGVLGILGTVFSRASVAERVQLALPVQALLIVIATVLMFTPGANAWFRRRAA